MKKVFLVVITLLAFQTLTFAQAKKQKKTETATAVLDSVKWRVEHYIVNRDSAYADPRLGLKKLMGGNRRFVEGKSIKPRQDAQTIKKLEFG